LDKYASVEPPPAATVTASTGLFGSLTPSSTKLSDNKSIVIRHEGFVAQPGGLYGAPAQRRNKYN